MGTQPQSLGKTQIGFQMWNSIWVYSCGPHFWVLFFGSLLPPMWLNFLKPKMGLTKWVLFLHQCGCSCIYHSFLFIYGVGCSCNSHYNTHKIVYINPSNQSSTGAHVKRTLDNKNRKEKRIPFVFLKILARTCTIQDH